MAVKIRTAGTMTAVEVEGGAAPSFTANAVQFDGSTDYYINGGTFTGISDSKVGMISMWINLAVNPGGPFIVTAWQTSGFASSAFAVAFQGGFAKISLYNAGGSAFTQMLTNSGLGSPSGTPSGASPFPWDSTAGWRWLAFSWNLAGLARTQSASNMYTVGGGLDQWDGSTLADDTVSYPTNGYPSVGSQGFGSNAYNGGVAELMFWNGVSLDLSNTSVLRTLISATGHPVDPGATGSLVTGSAPTFYFKGPAATFTTNAAGHGNIVLNDGGGVTNAPTNP